MNARNSPSLFTFAADMRYWVLPLLLAYGLLTLKPAVVLVWFAANQEAIVQTLCEQRDAPRNCCQGSCVLNKALNGREQPQPAPNNTPELRPTPPHVVVEPSVAFSYASGRDAGVKYVLSNETACAVWCLAVPTPPPLG